MTIPRRPDGRLAPEALAGRVAIVTGASRGIGKGCALELAAGGALVYLTGRTVEEGSAPLPGTIGATVKEIEAEGGRGVGVACDHRDDAQVEALFERVLREQGRLDVLVNNAFLIPRELMSGRPFWEVPISNWDDMIGVGTRSAYVASAFAARSMAKQGNGLIANVSSSVLAALPAEAQRLLDITHLRFFTLREMKELFERARLEVVSTQRVVRRKVLKHSNRRLFNCLGSFSELQYRIPGRRYAQP